MNKHQIVKIAALSLIVLSFPLFLLKTYFFQKDLSAQAPAEFVGKEACMDCHAIEYNLWMNSDHDNAMDTATVKTVLGDFDNAVFENHGFENKFYTKDGKYFVYTKGPDGQPGEFRIAYTFGVRPLQQYLIPFENGRYQCLPIAWSTVTQEWFSLADSVYGRELKPDEWLYWTNNGQNWNGMCAECHSTNLQKNYDPKTSIFRTTWSEIDVSCEACHGPASEHIEWAKIPAMARPQDTNTGLVVQTSNITSKQYIDNCAYCHARRSSYGNFAYPPENLYDLISPALPIEPSYHVDGQIKSEDYVFASFTQSRMYMKDVRCSDCHDVHSLKFKFDGNDLCTQCHIKKSYDAYEHHFHKYAGENGKPLVLDGGKRTVNVGEGAQCINCHMPGQYYMGVDLRSDHSMRIPRPDFSMQYDVPNACNQCHSDKTAAWADSYITKWYGIKKRPHFGSVIALASENDTTAIRDLLQIAMDELEPPIVRATAVHFMDRFHQDAKLDSIKKEMLYSPEPLIRREAVRNFIGRDVNDVITTLVPLLNDARKMVRIEVVARLTALPQSDFNSPQKAALSTGVKEYISAMEYTADFAESRHNLGNLYSNLGDFEKAEENYLAALKIDKAFYPSGMNLVLLYSRNGESGKAEQLLRQIVQDQPEVPDAYYYLGLLLAENKKYDESITYLEKAAKQSPGEAKVFYNLAMMYDFMKEKKKAEITLNKALSLEPDNLKYLYAALQFYIKNENRAEAKKIAKDILSRYPNHPEKKQLLEFLNN